jgi:hypothetical protein
MRSEQTAKRVVGGAGLGAVIGGIAGNAGMGAAIGAVAGTTAALVQKGHKVSVPSETLIEFRPQQPASLPARKITRGSANKVNFRASLNRRESMHEGKQAL